MWNYDFVIPCALMLFTTLVYYFNKPRLPIRVNRTFIGLIALQLLCMLADVTSSKMDENFSSYSVEALYLANGAFFVLYLARAYWFYRLTLDIVHIGSTPRRWLERVCAVPFVIAELVAVSSYWTGALFSITSKGYMSGPLYNGIYLYFVGYILLSIALLVRHAKRLNRYEFDTALAFNVLLIAGNAARFLLPNMLIIDLFCVMAINIAFLGFLNPDLFTTERGLAFNKDGFRLLLAQASMREDYHVLGIVLQNYYHVRGMLGGQEMDEAITHINEWLLATFPQTATSYLGGGRFMLVGGERNDWEDISRRISARFDETWPTEFGALQFNVAFAYVSAESGLTSADQISNNLTIALDTAQQDLAVGRDEAIDPHSIREVDKQVSILRMLEYAVRNNEVEVYLQPLVDSKTRRLVAAEALARIDDGEGGILSPGQFIAMAEKSGYINQLGEIVFEKTCAFIAEHDTQAMGLEWINVNVSPIQCLQQNLVERFMVILRAYGVRPEQIHLEITEQSIVDYALFSKQVLALRDAGFVFVLDDYGTGHSNLMRVKRYPFENVKLDMEVVRDWLRARDILVPLVVKGFKETGYTVTAEGIETEEMADAVTEIGCDYLQGYLFSRPIAMEDFARKYLG
ncbi:MAG: EAL domain-containing protein [Atopobiaceae bacterium]|nr:EAL domain-containing protein [Atopobiaceae bacterium]